MVAARVEEYGLDGRAVGGDMWSRGGPESSLCFAGANLVPLLGNPDDIQAFAERAVRGPRLCSSIVGRAELALPLWEHSNPTGGLPREVRAEQPLLVLDREPRIDARSARAAGAPGRTRRLPPRRDLDVHRGGRSRPACRRRGRGIPATGREPDRRRTRLGALRGRPGRVQGRGRVPCPRRWARSRACGSTRTNAAPVSVPPERPRSAQPSLRPVVCRSLYVNSFNTRARATYERIGFRQVATFTTVLLD